MRRYSTGVTYQGDAYQGDGEFDTLFQMRINFPVPLIPVPLIPVPLIHSDTLKKQDLKSS